jgi:hypothetical protein
MSTDSVSIWHRRWPVNSTMSTGCRRSSTSSSRIPIISQVKLIAEPWDIGEGGYQVGNFPPGWSEWNGKYRDCVRDFWRGQDQTLGEFAYRLTGSSDLYENTGRCRSRASTSSPRMTDSPCATWFPTTRSTTRPTVRKIVTARVTTAPGTAAPRGRHPIPEVTACGRSNGIFLRQSCAVPRRPDAARAVTRSDGPSKGNNNAYCQDNEISWYDWENVDKDLLAFTRRLIALRLDHPVFRRRRWFQGRAIHGDEIKDIAWFTPDGVQMAEEHWGEGYASSLGVFINGRSITTSDPERVLDDGFYLHLQRSSRSARLRASRLASGQSGGSRNSIRNSGWSDDEKKMRGWQQHCASSPVPSWCCAVSAEPLATYRLQLHPGFTLDDASAVVPYLAQLGISHVYLSPFLQAAPGSTHGYDVVDPSRVNRAAGWRGGAPATLRGTERRRDGPSAGHRAQSYGHCRRPESLVVGCPRERSLQPLCALLRRGLGIVGGTLAEQGPAAGAGRPLRPSARSRRSATSFWRGPVHPALSRTPFPHRPFLARHLCCNAFTAAAVWNCSASWRSPAHACHAPRSPRVS